MSESKLQNTLDVICEKFDLTYDKKGEGFNYRKKKDKNIWFIYFRSLSNSNEYQSSRLHQKTYHLLHSELKKRFTNEI